jgi:hypothetical protein
MVFHEMSLLGLNGAVALACRLVLVVVWIGLARSLVVHPANIMSGCQLKVSHSE